MIKKFYTGTTQEPFAVQNGIVQTAGARQPQEEVEICQCIGQDCERTLTVYGDLNDGSDRKNDKTSFLYRVMASSDTATLKLFKDDVEVAILNDNTYGEFFDFGSLNGGIAEQDLYTGYIIYWEWVLFNLGVGQYTIKAELTQFGNVFLAESVKYTLKKFSELDADGSVKMVTFQNGNIESSNFNFTGLNWYQAIRFNGILWNKQSQYISDTYFTTNRTITQIQDSIENTWDLQIEFVQDSVSNFIIQNNVLANRILVSDYNLTNTGYYNDVELAIKEISSSTELYQYNGRCHVLQLTDRIQNIRKRNY